MEGLGVTAYLLADKAYALSSFAVTGTERVFRLPMKIHKERLPSGDAIDINCEVCLFSDDRYSVSYTHAERDQLSGSVLRSRRIKADTPCKVNEALWIDNCSDSLAERGRGSRREERWPPGTRQCRPSGRNKVPHRAVRRDTVDRTGDG